MADVEAAGPRGTCVKDVPAADFVRAYAAHLKREGKIEIPQWVDIVKTAPHKELAPVDEDWFYTRCASIARKLYVRPNIGVGGLAKIYGSKANRGVKREHYKKASAGIIRYMLKQLEAIDILEQVSEGKAKGRRVSSTGQQALDRIAGAVREAVVEAEEGEAGEEAGSASSSSSSSSSSESGGSDSD